MSHGQVVRPRRTLATSNRQCLHRRLRNRLQVAKMRRSGLNLLWLSSNVISQHSAYWKAIYSHSRYVPAACYNGLTKYLVCLHDLASDVLPWTRNCPIQNINSIEISGEIRRLQIVRSVSSGEALYRGLASNSGCSGEISKEDRWRRRRQWIAEAEAPFCTVPSDGLRERNKPLFAGHPRPSFKSHESPSALYDVESSDGLAPKTGRRQSGVLRLSTGVKNRIGCNWGGGGGGGTGPAIIPSFLSRKALKQVSNPYWRTAPRVGQFSVMQSQQIGRREWWSGERVRQGKARGRGKRRRCGLCYHNVTHLRGVAVMQGGGPLGPVEILFAITQNTLSNHRSRSTFDVELGIGCRRRKFEFYLGYGAGQRQYRRRDASHPWCSIERRTIMHGLSASYARARRWRRYTLEQPRFIALHGMDGEHSPSFRTHLIQLKRIFFTGSAARGNGRQFGGGLMRSLLNLELTPNLRALLWCMIYIAALTHLRPDPTGRVDFG
ncbi:hypothetical protein C8R45DRAFT_932463 [Mycena sanguinolenta]|nr:hypothetical protein C8R45DRAFT_932463 [Mycena sanguinolenta]